MLTALIEFSDGLRNGAIPISMVEALDAAHALRHIDLGSRAELKAALAAVLVKRAEHRAPFAALFDISFVPRRAEVSRPAGAPATLPPPLPADLTEAAVGEGGSEDLLAALLEALRRNDAGALRAIAALAVQRFGGLDVQRDGTVQYYLYRVLRQLDLSNLMQRAMRDGGGTGADARRLGDRLLQDEHRHRIEAFRRLIADEIRHRLLELKGFAAAEPPIEDVDFLGASPTELREMRNAIRPLARRSEEHTSELQSRSDIVCRPLLEKKSSINCRRP